MLSHRFHLLLLVVLAISTPAKEQNVAGQNRATAATPARVTPGTDGHQKMLALLKEIRRRTPDEHSYLGDRGSRVLKADLAALPANVPAARRWYVHWKLATSNLNLGREQSAILHFSKASDLLPEVRDGLPRDEANQFIFERGVAYMRVGETQNCCNRFTPESCLLPIRGQGIHIEKGASKQAIEYFTEVLEGSPKDSLLHLGSRWLLNIAYMTIGAHPDAVPEAYRIDPKAFESDEPFPRFINVAPRLGLDTFSLSGGAIADDFDNDGYRLREL